MEHQQKITTIPRSDKMYFEATRRRSKNNSILLICSIVLVYSITSFLMFWQLGFLPIVEDVMFSTPDSQGYRAYADFFAGNASLPSTSLVSHRPFVFPLYLSLYHYVGINGFFVIQWLLNLLTIVMTFATILF
jgi:hypothetical protein